VFWRFVTPCGAKPCFFSGCATIQIGRILDDPDRFRNRSVRVEGAVVAAAGALGAGAYQVQDSSGKIYVVSRTGVPRTGTHVQVEGPVVSSIELMGQSFGAAIRERKHKVKH
jgi:hypothetical protein